jgi:predicted nuclease of restriction endonuclease-like (RecB) superfamily
VGGKMDERKRIGKDKDGVNFPIAPNIAEMSDGYLQFIDSIKKEINNQRISVILKANSSMICLYWNIGNAILQKQQEEGWGTKVIDRISHDIKYAFPDMKGFSPRNIKYMRKFADEWRDYEIVQQVAAQIPWRSNMILLDKLSNQESRIWYAKKTLEYGWSSNILDLQIQSRLIERTGKSINNFEVVLPPVDSDMANTIFKDPYLFDFLGTDIPRREVEIERELTEHIQQFLLELGQGFAFVGRQVHLEVGEQDFYLDLLFYHLKLRCYVVIELKACDFEPGFISQLNMYQNVVNDILKHPNDKPTIGLLLVKGKNKTVVEYSISGYENPIGVADWQEKLTKELPEDLQSSLPTIEEIEREIE